MYKYKIRYLVEPWNKPRGEAVPTMVDGVKVSVDNYGYADELFVASIMHEKAGGESILLLSSEGEPTRALLEKIRTQIDHYLEHHV